MKKLCVILTLLIIGTGLAVLVHSHAQSPTEVVAPPTTSFVALGDSIAAGVGLKPDSDSSACNRTDQSYPNLVASHLHMRLVNLACSGATLTAGILGKQDVNQLLVPSQLDQLFAQPKPDLMSLTVGANDTGWTTLLSKCYTGVCGSDTDTAAYTKNLVDIANNLRQALSMVQAHYKNGVPPVIITEYHQVFPTAVPSGCSDLAGIDSNELAWGRDRQSSLNDTIQRVSQEPAFASFVRPVAVDFSGHELCSADSWVQGLGDPQPYHPTATGQAEFAKRVIAAAGAKK